MNCIISQKRISVISVLVFCIMFTFNCYTEKKSDNKLFTLLLIANNTKPAKMCMAPGETISDISGDIAGPYLDIISVQTSLVGEQLTATFFLRDVPETLEFNKAGNSKNTIEYSWSIYIDSDNDLNSGFSFVSPTTPKGADYFLTVNHVVDDNPTQTLPINSGMSGLIMQYSAQEKLFHGYANSATFSFDSSANKIILSATVPGITSASRLSYASSGYSNGGSAYDTCD